MSKVITSLSIYDQSVEVPSHLFNSGSRKIGTERSRHHAVRQAIAMMRSHFQNPLTLQEIADSAQLSPFHFNRVFRSITGIPPSVYLAALRIEQAKKLLMKTDLSVTCICFDVGYNSLGTFTTRFTQFVGATPTQLRQISQDKGLHSLLQDWELLKDSLALLGQRLEKSTIEGKISVSQPFEGLIFIGVFTDPIPQGPPVSCTVLTEPGDYYLTSIPEGKYYLFAAALPRTDDFIGMLEARSSLRCTAQQPLSLQHEGTRKSIDLVLKPMHWTDAPILIALPWLLISRFAKFSQVPSGYQEVAAVGKNSYGW
ncbi:helix-turn-helix domain-containing protein [Reticulibacter mediterranei]|uniref:helix-turn-helix domain-containing protein n=1 Tax=Reticulibacter mediterranei TaxID=2778369 RepID=UPI001C68C68F|nr:AraC family transcriptional regulator [Reticulibacter mediterranei]